MELFVKDYILMVGFALSFITCGVVICLILKYGRSKEQFI